MKPAILTAAWLALAPIGAAAQIQEPMVPLAPGTDLAQTCRDVGGQFKGMLAGGQVLDRSRPRSGYAIHAPMLIGYVVKIDNLRVLDAKAYVSSPRVPQLIACHARLTLQDGSTASGAMVLQRFGLQMVMSWIGDD